MIVPIRKTVAARMMAMLMLVFWCVIALAPLAAAAHAQPSPLPACCRNHGVHSCSGGGLQANAGTASVSAPCPYLPPAASVSATDVAAYAVTGGAWDSITFAAFSSRAATSKTSTQRLRANAQRGPPLSTRFAFL